MHTKITSAVLLALASASIILAAPATSKRAADPGIICPLHCVGGDCADCPSLPPREESNVELAIRAVPGCPFNCNEDGCDLCGPPSQFEVSKEKREETGLIPVRYVKRVEDLECIPGQNPWPPTLVCAGEGCINCPPDEDNENVKREEDHICTTPPEKRDCEDVSCIHCFPPPDGTMGQVKRAEPELIPVRHVKRVEDLECIPGQNPWPPSLVCAGEGCINCPPDPEPEKEKRDPKFCSPSCIGEHCGCDEEEEKEVKPLEVREEDFKCITHLCPPFEEETQKKEKRGQHGCIPHCVGEHCQCEDEEE